MSIWPIALLALIIANTESVVTQSDDNTASALSPTPDLLEYMDEFDGLDLESLPAVSPTENIENVEQTLQADAPQH